MRFRPRITLLAQTNPSTTSFIEYRSRSGRAPRTKMEDWCDLARISPLLLGAVTMHEDVHFFRHHGLWVAEMSQRVITALWMREKIHGVSTITMQLARNLFLTPERTLTRKAKEIVLAVCLEVLLSKGRILELYFNVIEWGAGIWGVRAASRHYFGKSPDELDGFEACLLTSLIPAPLLPLTGRNRQRAQFTQNLAAGSLFLSGMIESDECCHLFERNTCFNQLLEQGASVHDALVGSTHPWSRKRDYLAGVRLCKTPLGLEGRVKLQDACARYEQEAQRLERICGPHKIEAVLTTGDLDTLESALSMLV